MFQSFHVLLVSREKLPEEFVIPHLEISVGTINHDSRNLSSIWFKICNIESRILFEYIQYTLPILRQHTYFMDIPSLGFKIQDS